MYWGYWPGLSLSIRFFARIMFIEGVNCSCYPIFIFHGVSKFNSTLFHLHKSTKQYIKRHKKTNRWKPLKLSTKAQHWLAYLIGSIKCDIWKTIRGDICQDYIYLILFNTLLQELEILYWTFIWFCLQNVLVTPRA